LEPLKKCEKNLFDIEKLRQSWKSVRNMVVYGTYV
jgi:hypothetical protein